jgi:hypothetical protein
MQRRPRTASRICCSAPSGWILPLRRAWRILLLRSTVQNCNRSVQWANRI